MMEVLGRGGFATVYKAKYLATGEIRAVKQMKKSKLGGQISRKEFEILR